jgi:hypothetical protein
VDGLRFNILPALKPGGSVSAGIEDLKQSKVFVCGENFWHEYQEYRWQLDADKNPTGSPVKANDHLLDGLRYVKTRRTLRTI